MRAERDARSIGIGTSALASGIVLVCKMDVPRSAAADIDGHDTRFGSVQAARGAPIFLGSALSNAAQWLCLLRRQAWSMRLKASSKKRNGW